ncbi:MAG: PHP domain-containing protein [Chlamydiia bacterium]|nr:PHP domain-containing protein [Chlamydiia bacterium]
MTPFADLHCHTTHSDGTATPEEILDLAKKKGFKGVSITDHDTATAYPGLFEKAEEMGLELITGVEFSCQHKGVSVHVLGYHFDINANPINGLFTRHKARREERNAQIFEKLKNRNIDVTFDDIRHYGGVLGRPHIALALMEKGYVASVREAFNKYLAEGKSCYAPGHPVSVEETIDVIQTSGGKAVIAHPHLLNSPKTLQDLLQMPFDGMETKYANFSEEKNKRWEDLAQRKGWLETAGSDYHGTIKPTLHYGASYVDEAKFRKLQS